MPKKKKTKTEETSAPAENTEPTGDDETIVPGDEPTVDPDAQPGEDEPPADTELDDPSLLDLGDAGDASDEPEEPEPEPETRLEPPPTLSLDERETLRLSAIKENKDLIEGLEDALKDAQRFIEDGKRQIEEATERLRQLGGLPVPKTTPGLRLLNKRPLAFWCIGKELEAGKPLDVALENLSDEHQREIDIKKKGNHISVEEIEVEVEEV